MTVTNRTTVASLKTALNHVSPAMQSNAHIRALSCVRLGLDRITATDMVASIDAPAYGCSFDPILVPHADLKRVLGALKASDWIELEPEGEGIAVSSPRGRTVIEGVELADWPTWADELGELSFYRPADPVSAAGILRDVSKHESGDDTRPVLTSTYLLAAGGSLRVESCDSYRLAADVIEGVDSSSLVALAPLSRYVKKLSRVDIVASTLAATEERRFEDPHNRLVLTDSEQDVRIILRMTTGQWLDAVKLTPDYPEHVFELPADLLGGIEYAVKAVKPRNEPFELTFDADTLAMKLSVQNRSSHEANYELQSGYVDEPIRFGVNPAYLQDAIRFVGESARWEMVSGIRPALLHSAERASRTMLIMPTKLRD